MLKACYSYGLQVHKKHGAVAPTTRVLVWTASNWKFGNSISVSPALL